jgi:hypothetical protein
MEPKIYPDTGSKYYESQPENTRPAKKEDFFENGKPKIGMYYLLHCWYLKTYIVYRVNFNFKYEVNVLPWVKDGRCFVKNDC